MIKATTQSIHYNIRKSMKTNHMGVSGVSLICLSVMPSKQSICGREGICTISYGREWSHIDMFIGDAVTKVYR